MDAEENEGCGAPLAETPGTEEETCEEALLWIDEMMAGMKFPIARTTASVREPANWGDQELEAVLVTGLSDFAEDGRESWVGKPTDNLVVGRARKNRKPETGKTFAHNQEKTLRYSNRKPSQPKFGQNKKKHYATRTPRHATTR